MDWTNKYVGLPFEEKGRTRLGLDCWGLVRLVYREQLAIALPSMDDYITTEDIQQISKLVKDNKDNDWVEVKDMQNFDVVLMRMQGQPVHVGILVAPGLMMHIERGINVCLEKTTSMKWKKRILGYYRHKRLC